MGDEASRAIALEQRLIEVAGAYEHAAALVKMSLQTRPAPFPWGEASPDATCTECGHLLRQHDPEDGECDAHASEGFGKCGCRLIWPTRNNTTGADMSTDNPLTDLYEGYVPIVESYKDIVLALDGQEPRPEANDTVRRVWRLVGLDQPVRTVMDQRLIETESEHIDRYTGVGVLELALGLRTQHSGSSDPWPDDEVERVVAFLRMRLDGWRPSVPFMARFDNAVREVVEAALAEVGRG